MAAALIMFAPTAVSAAVDSTATNSNAGLGYLGAALATGLACIGAGYGVGVVGSASLGAISENERCSGRTLIYVGLAERARDLRSDHLDRDPRQPRLSRNS